MNYQQALEVVKTAVQFGGEAHYLAQAFAETNDTQQAVEIVAEAFHQASQGVTDFDLTVEQYLVAMLDEQDKFKDADAFADEDAANYEGFFWIDEVSKYLKLNF